MKKTLLLTMMMAAIISGCQKDEMGFKQGDSVRASIEADALLSRTILNVNSVVWEAGEKISIFSQKEDSYVNNEYTLSDGDGTSNATFSGLFEGTKKVAAMYPYHESNTYSSEGVIAYTLPSTHNYTEGCSNKSPMAALTSGSNIAFKNAGALMCLTVNNIPAGYNQAILKAVGSSDCAIAGAAKITFSGSEPILTIDNTDSANKKITINFEATTGSTSNKTFYFPLPIAEYESLEFSISDGSNVKVLKTKELNAQRNNRYTSIITLDEVTGSTPTPTTVEKASETLKTATNISISSVTENATITLPTETNGDAVSIAFDSFTTESTVTIAATEESLAPKTLNITVPTEGDKAKLDINLPNTTVTITATGAEGKIPEVTAVTAEHTLIIESGVLIGDLKVVKGNIRLKSGAGIENVIDDREDKNKVVYIYNEGGAIEANVPSGFVVVNLSDEVAEVSTAEQLLGASQIAKNIKLTGNVSLANPVTVLDGQTYNLNGKTITSLNHAFVVTDENVTATIKNGSIAVSGEAHVSVFVKRTANNANLTLDGLNISETESAETDIYSSIYKNGSADKCVMTISNCTINGSNGIYISDDNSSAANTLTIKNSTIESSVENCINVLNTNLTAEGCTFKNTLEKQTEATDAGDGNDFYDPRGRCIAFTNVKGQAAKGSATLSGNTYSIADNNGEIIFNQKNGAVISINEISTVNDMLVFAETVNGGNTYSGKTVKLTADVDLNKKAWTPIAAGTRSGNKAIGARFKGVFDGNGKTIKNLEISSGNADDAVGLFGIIDGGTVKNLTFTGVNINVPNCENAGTVAGLIVNGGKIDHVTVSGNVAAKRGNGGIVGRMLESGTVSYCTNNAALTAVGASCGGIVGAAYYTVDGSEMFITECTNNGTIKSTSSCVGGIVGFSAANISKCVNDVQVIGAGDCVGGIVGEMQNAGSVTECTNNKDVVNNGTSSDNYATGGIVGWVRYTGTTSNYPRKEVIEITGNINKGNVKGCIDAGGIVGVVYNLGKINNNKNYAASLQGTTFVAGIVANAQFAEETPGLELTDRVEVMNNLSTTNVENMTGICKDLYVYDNTSGVSVVKLGNTQTE